jgi:hypothetical protein
MRRVVGGRDASTGAVRSTGRARRAAQSLIANLRRGAADITGAAASRVARDVHAAARTVAKAVLAGEAAATVDASGGAAGRGRANVAASPAVGDVRGEVEAGRAAG